MIQHAVEDGNKRPLQEFAESAVIYLKQHPECNEGLLLQ